MSAVTGWFVLAFGIMPLFFSGSVSSVDCALIRNRIRIVLLQEPLLSESDMEKILRNQLSDGKWIDIDYDARNYSNWPSAEHLRRCLHLARAWAKSGQSCFHDDRIGTALRCAVVRWCTEKRQCGNWWWNKIFVPGAMTDILLLAPELFSDSEKCAALEIASQAELGMTGQNRIWLAENVFKRALLEEDVLLLRKAVSEITVELRVSEEEGIRADGSFHQHGSQLQFGNYGLSFLASFSSWASIFHNTGLALSPEQWRILELFIFDGCQWVLWNGRLDYLSSGRQLGRGASEGKGGAMLRSIERLGKCTSRRSAEYREILKRNRGGENTLVGNRHFWKSDYMVHRRSRWYASVRMNSVATVPVEDSVNWDNALGRYFSDGVMLVMISGDEYRDITACWDWTRLPGTTLPATPVLTEKECRERNIKKGTLYPRWTLGVKKRRIGESVFTGGVSDGRHGVAVYSMNLDGVQAKKAYFFDDDAICALGCGITSHSPYSVATTVESSLHRGNVKCGNGWVWHNNIGYIGKNLSVHTGIREGDWCYIEGGIREPCPETKDLFHVIIDHGINPRHVSYAYTILPCATAEETAASKGVKVLVNNEKVQAVAFADESIGAIFYEPGELSGFTAERPGLYLIHADEFFYADPAAKKPAGRIKR